MGFLDGIKHFLGLSEKRGTLPEPINEGWIVLKRRDGTEIMLKPGIDENGNQLCKRIFDDTTGQMQSVHEYIISCPEVKKYYGCDVQSILMGIDRENLSNPRYSDFIANKLLASHRMGKIWGEYEGYAGEIYIHQDGTLEKGIYPGVVKTLKRQRIAKEEDAKRRCQEDTDKKIEKLMGEYGGMYCEPNQYAQLLGQNDDGKNLFDDR